MTDAMCKECGFRVVVAGTPLCRECLRVPCRQCSCALKLDDAFRDATGWLCSDCLANPKPIGAIY